MAWMDGWTNVLRLLAARCRGSAQQDQEGERANMGWAGSSMRCSGRSSMTTHDRRFAAPFPMAGRPGPTHLSCL
ncbi:hypothetical protein CGRA01v4_02722 [Colletotrichum graminicola]|nr:hypothetical protein CGRA01v4_02722 [Colletotrichum graminicola]